MTENTKIKFSVSQELVKYCDSTIDILSKLHGQLIKIIAVKKKLSTSASSSVVFNQAQDIAGAIANLEKINVRLSGAIDEAKQLVQQVQLSLQISNANVQNQKEQ